MKTKIRYFRRTEFNYFLYATVIYVLIERSVESVGFFSVVMTMCILYEFAEYRNELSDKLAEQDKAIEGLKEKIESMNKDQ